MSNQQEQKQTPLIELKNIHVSYGNIKVLKGISLYVNAGEIVAIMGPNGCGKTTTIKSLFGIAPIEKGSLFFRAEQLNPIPHELVSMGIAYVPQGRRVYRNLSVRENLEMGGFFLNNQKEANRRIDEVLDFFPELVKKLNSASGSLSGGQQQMLAIARGLMTNPQILLLDEPTLGLSPKIVKEMFAVIEKINKERNVSVIIVEHNIKSLLPITDRVYVIDAGEIKYEGTPGNFSKTNLFEEVFLGKTA
jgi:branched-chain amino acid transport system ATP-binding protein